MTIQKKKLTVVVSVTALALAAALYGWQRPVHRGASMTPPALAQSSLNSWRNQGRETKEGDSVPGKSTTGKFAPGKSRVVSYKESFAQASNYWTYAQRILPAAKAGDAEAQFYLARLMERCSEDLSMYFQHRGVRLNMDEALQFAVQRQLPVERVQTVYDRCHEFQDHDPAELGVAADWLAKATEAGQPNAQTITALKIFLHDSQVNMAKAGGVSDPGPEVGAGADSRELLRAAVESKDPEVLFTIGELQGMLNKDASPADEKTTRFAWWLVACQRGLDCSTKADWVINSCSVDPTCLASNDFVRTLSGDHWPEVQQRALEINAKLDAGNWDALGLGS